MKNVRCGVEFSRCPPVYQPGETVEATVTLQVRTATKLSSISVRILGQTQVDWVEKQKSAEGKVVKLPYSQQQVHLDATVNLSDYVRKYSDSRLRCGDHRLNFNFQLPSSNIPPTFKGKSAEISYVCQVEIVGMKPANSQTVPVPFQVWCPADPKFFCPHEISDSLTVSSCFRRLGEIDVRIGLEKRIFTCGEEISVALTINNRSSKPVGILRSTLLSTAHYKGVGPNGSKWERLEKPKTLAQNKCAGQLAPGDIFNVPNLPAVIIPKSLTQLSVENCDNIRLGYTLRVRIADRFNFDLPIFISV